jgi:predicted AlkP superfamily pyrophosphatase or phosphodiesterase
MGDLVLFAKPGYAFQSPFNGEESVVEAVKYLGSHGYPSDDPELDGVFIAWGYGIKPGARLDRMESVDVAPTLAELLGVKLPNVDGKVLREILK